MSFTIPLLMIKWKIEINPAVPYGIFELTVSLASPQWDFHEWKNRHTLAFSLLEQTKEHC